MQDEQLLRYSRQIMLPHLDAVGQARLLESHALIIGAGGLGSPAAMYLAAAGIGQLTIMDGDKVDLSNLQRQIAHATADIGANKAESARRTVLALNPEIRVTAIPQHADDTNLSARVAAADVVLDCSDNFATRFLVNATCVSQHKPLISGAAIRYEGQLWVFDPKIDNCPCYRCLYPETAEGDDAACTRNGVLAPIPGIIGSLQALEAIKVLLAIGQTLTGRLLLFDGLALIWRDVTFRRNPACPVCAMTKQD